MKVKIGDKVKILPSALEICVDESAIYKTAVVNTIYDNVSFGGDYEISVWDGKFNWRLRDWDFIKQPATNEQLVFPFMREQA